ncbi:MAG TPA: META domain-containing protein [Leptolyngbyaceae cyanobacterium M65_K2018_010]|nr:META domain-containing protein [Leptolyngbyaceae cyanobacterium M65_K2018_010]
MLSFRSTAFVTTAFMLVGATSCTVPSTPATHTSLTGTVWELQQIQFNDGKLLPANPPENYTVEFTDRGEVFVRADCNRALGSFTQTDGQIDITLGPTTLVACPEGSIGTDFLTALDNSSLYFFQNENLFIDLAADSGTMQFSAAPPLSLTGQVWQLRTIKFNNDTELVADPPTNYTVEFFEDGKVAVRADCNRGMSTFTTDSDRRLTINPIATTLAACPPGSMGEDFVAALNNSALYFFQNGDLFIDLKFDSGTMQLFAAPAPDLVGPVWKLQQIQYNDGKLLTANPPENYTVQFMGDGSVAVQADCNRGRGTFTTTDNRLAVSGLATTRAACPPGSISNEFVAALGDSNSYFFRDGELFIEIKYDSGSMRFSAD